MRWISHVEVWASIMITLLFCTSCSPTSTPPVKTVELILPESALPGAWSYVYAPRPMGPSTGYGGTENDTYVPFGKDGNSTHSAYHFMMYFGNEKVAADEYENLVSSRFSNGRLGVGSPWTTPDEISFRSVVAEQYRVACSINTVAGRRLVCLVIARYGSYISMFHAAILPTTMSVSDFNDVSRKLDTYIVSKLDNGLETVSFP